MFLRAKRNSQQFQRRFIERELDFSNKRYRIGESTIAQIAIAKKRLRVHLDNLNGTLYGLFFLRQELYWAVNPNSAWLLASLQRSFYRRAARAFFAPSPGKLRAAWSIAAATIPCSLPLSFILSLSPLLSTPLHAANKHRSVRLFRHWPLRRST